MSGPGLPRIGPRPGADRAIGVRSRAAALGAARAARLVDPPTDGRR
jgi:hypothetical protein